MTVDWPSHPVDAMLAMWPADLPRPDQEQIAELRAICDQPVSVALVSMTFEASDIGWPTYVRESEYPSGVEFTFEEKRFLTEADAEVLRLMMAESEDGNG